MVCSHCPTKRPIHRPTKMGCIESTIICVGVGLCVGIGLCVGVGVGVSVGQCEHNIRKRMDAKLAK